MPISLNNIFGIHEQALMFRAKRAELLAANLANADTPNFKARDVDFASVMAQTENSPTQLKGSHAGHIVERSAWPADPGYRVPNQPTLDGNTVDTQIEQSQFLENALAYQTTLTLLGRRIQGLQLALKGE